ncbi:MAG: hypothetical protein A2158_02535 [Chloroflexi bacterium RBG_13_46_14]|nr:MAG: hypothetical protein A2158_02535 [Chloroflexi bacterium RBG_13_46_14]
MFKFYNAATDFEGELQWAGGEIEEEIPESLMYEPEETFAELDRYGIEAIIDNAKNSGIRIDVHFGEQNYDWPNMYRLDNGMLQPLSKVTFNTNESWVEIWISCFYSHEPDAPFTFGALKNVGDWWFTGSDLEKASSVVPAKNQQGEEFKEFLMDIYGILPEGWEMELGIREGHMSPPRGLDEPLFTLDFEDTENSFTIPGDPTGTKISPNLRLYFYDIEEKESILEVIEQQEKYSWDIPQYYDESSRYIAVTSPVYINSGWYEEEAMTYYETLEQALKDFFVEQRNHS